MGTNYYVVPNRPSVCDPIHIGKSSFGWRFLFSGQHNTWHNPPVIWDTYDDVRDWLKKNTVDVDDFVIINEYDEIVPFDDFIDLVESKQSINHPDQFEYCENVNGYRFSRYEFE